MIEHNEGREYSSTMICRCSARVDQTTASSRSSLPDFLDFMTVRFVLPRWRQTGVQLWRVADLYPGGWPQICLGWAEGHFPETNALDHIRDLTSWLDCVLNVRTIEWNEQLRVVGILMVLESEIFDHRSNRGDVGCENSWTEYLLIPVARQTRNVRASNNESRASRTVHAQWYGIGSSPAWRQGCRMCIPDDAGFYRDPKHRKRLIYPRQQGVWHAFCR